LGSELQNLFSELNNPHYKVALQLQGGGKDMAITGFLLDDISFRFDSHYGSLSKIFDTEQLNVLAGAVQGLIPGWDREYAILTFYSSIQYWTGYSHFETSLELSYPILDQNSYNNYKKNIKLALNSVLPVTGSGNFLVVAPNEYNPTSISGLKGHPKGTWILGVGSWLVIPGLLITGINVNFSRQAVHPKPGSAESVPLVARVSMNLRSWRLYTADEVRSFFKFP
jgi:hypothetical protein